MAKSKPDLTNLFANTAEQARAELIAESEAEAIRSLDEGRIQSTGVGLKTGEVEFIDALALKLETTRNAILRYAIRYFILQVIAGKIDLRGDIQEPPKAKKKLRLPK